MPPHTVSKERCLYNTSSYLNPLSPSKTFKVTYPTYLNYNFSTSPPPKTFEYIPASPTIMPGRPNTSSRHATFAPVPATYSRLPHDDEKLVLRRFAKHADTCSTCSPSKGDLCPKGYARAKDVEEYVFQKAGKAYSVVDLNSGRRMQIEIPSDCSSVVRDLFKGMERGLRTRASKSEDKPISYDRTYYVPPRKTKPDVVERKPRVAKYDIEEPKRTPTIKTSGSKYAKSGRPASYYDSGASPTYYTISPVYGASPVQGYAYGPDPYGYYY